MRSAQAKPRAVQRIAFSRPLGKNSTTMPPSKGRNVIRDNNGNIALPSHRVIKNNQYNAQQDSQGVVAHVAGLQAAQQGARPSQYPGYTAASAIEQIALQQIRCRAAYPLYRLNHEQDEQFIHVVLMKYQLVDQVPVLFILEAAPVQCPGSQDAEYCHDDTYTRRDPLQAQRCSRHTCWNARPL